MSMYEKIGKFIGGVLAVTITACAWLIIIAFNPEMPVVYYLQVLGVR